MGTLDEIEWEDMSYLDLLDTEDHDYDYQDRIRVRGLRAKRRKNREME